MDEATKDSLRTWVPVGTLVLTAFLVILTAIPYLRGAPVPSTTLLLLVILLIVSAVLGYITFPARRFNAYLARRAQAAPMPPDLSRELLANIASAKRIWSIDANYADSFGFAAQDILNSVNTKLANMQPIERIFLEQANGVINGARCERPVLLALVAQLEGIASLSVEGIDRDTLLVGLSSLVSIASAGVNTANQFAQTVSNAKFELERYVREEWAGFAAKANRLSDDLSKLGEKYKSVTGEDPKVYISQVRGL